MSIKRCIFFIRNHLKQSRPSRISKLSVNNQPRLSGTRQHESPDHHSALRLSSARISRSSLSTRQQESPDHRPALSRMATVAAPALASTPQEWTYEQLITTVLKSNEDTIYWLQSKDLLASSMECPKCPSQCRLVKRKGTLYWRCPRKGCQAVISVREKSC